MNDASDGNPLHAPLLPILRLLLNRDAAPVAPIVLDVACGYGDKFGLLHEHYGQDALVVGMDWDPTTIITCHSISPTVLLGDAAHIPLATASCDRATCIAALGLFADPVAATCEMRRVLRANGRALVVTASQRWVEVTHWPNVLRPELEKAYQTALLSGTQPPHNPDAVESLVAQLCAAGFRNLEPRAFWMNHANPFDAELALLNWQQLAPLVEPYLDTTHLEAYAQAETEIELCSLTIASWAM